LLVGLDRQSCLLDHPGVTPAPGFGATDAPWQSRQLVGRALRDCQKCVKFSGEAFTGVFPVRMNRARHVTCYKCDAISNIDEETGLPVCDVSVICPYDATGGKAQRRKLIGK